MRQRSVAARERQRIIAREGYEVLRLTHGTPKEVAQQEELDAAATRHRVRTTTQPRKARTVCEHGRPSV